MSEKVELTKEQYEQLFQYYKNKSINLELEFLLLQINSKDTISGYKNKYESLSLAKEKEYNDLIEKERDIFEENKKVLKIEIDKLNKKIMSSKTINKKT
jgi:RNase adaptor protein for sRNA GlmZ degradation